MKPARTNRKGKRATAPHGRAGKNSASNGTAADDGSQTSLNPSTSRELLAFPLACGAATRKPEEDARGQREVRISQPTADFETGGELAAAISQKCDLVELGIELLKEGGPSKHPNIKLRMWENLVEQLWGKPGAAASAEPTPVRVVWDIPAPARGSAPK